MMSQVDLDAIEEEVRLCFVQEDAPEHLAALERGILLLNQAGGQLVGDENAHHWTAMMRSAHTLKGGAALSQLLDLSQLAHLVEDLLQALSDRRVDQPELACQLLMCSIDDMQMLLDQVIKGNPNPQSSVLDDFKTFISTALQSNNKDADTHSGSATEEAFLVRTVLEGDFKNCIVRGKKQIEQATKNAQILQILTEVVQECGVLAEVLNLEELHRSIQKIVGALTRTPKNPPRFARRILSYLELERKKNLHYIQVSESKKAEALHTNAPSVDLNGAQKNSVSTPPPNVTSNSGNPEANGRVTVAPPRERDTQPNLAALPNAEPDYPSIEVFDNSEPLSSPMSEAMSFEEAGALARPNSTLPPTPSEQIQPEQPQTSSGSLRTQVVPSPELTMRVPVRRLDELADIVGEMLITYERLTLDQKRLQHTNRDLKQLTRQFYTIRERIQSLYDQLLVPGRSYSQSLEDQEGFDPLEMDEFTDLHSVLQDFQELLARIEEGSQDIDVLTQANLDDSDHLRQQMGELRHGLTDARMVPFATLANRFRRPLWDLNQRYEKSVQLSIEGEMTPIDRAVLEHLYEPMLHLIRNAFDHGIENPKERASKGKPTSGNIKLAALHQGTQVMITIQDDGRGIDFEKVRYRAEQLGLIFGDTVTSQQLLQCLFTPGFSTRTQVNELSGRGVGLDVVKAQVENLRGTIQVYSSPGQGTHFKLTIPLTLNIMPLLVCQRLLPDGHSLTLAVPSSHISEIVDKPHFTETEKLIRWRNKDIPYVALEQLMPFSDQQTLTAPRQMSPSSTQGTNEPTIAVILSLTNQPIAIGINQLLGEQEMVLKSFDSLVTVPRYLPGCTVLPNGQVVLVLSPDPLEDLIQEREVRVSPPTQLQLTPAQAVTQVKSADFEEESPKPLPSSKQLLSSDEQLSELTHHLLPDDASTQEEHPGEQQRNANTPRTIMVVDDSVAARRWMVRSLERSGYQVLQCRDGQDAWDTLEKGARCHLVVCDIEMPRLNGFQLLSQIRQSSALKSLPFALLTSRQGDRHRKQASQLGANGYYIKPLGGQQLLLNIENLIEDQAASLRSI
jgi:type IV pili sensor histidine kinase/response regulator